MNDAELQLFNCPTRLRDCSGKYFVSSVKKFIRPTEYFECPMK